MTIFSKISVVRYVMVNLTDNSSLQKSVRSVMTIKLINCIIFLHTKTSHKWDEMAVSYRKNPENRKTNLFESLVVFS